MLCACGGGRLYLINVRHRASTNTNNVVELPTSFTTGASLVPRPPPWVRGYTGACIRADPRTVYLSPPRTARVFPRKGPLRVQPLMMELALRRAPRPSGLLSPSYSPHTAPTPIPAGMKTAAIYYPLDTSYVS